MPEREYTPDTAEVRTAFGFFGTNVEDWESPPDKALAHAEFDRWLVEYRRSVIREVHDEVRLIPCYGAKGRFEFDVGDNARGQVLDIIRAMGAA